MKEIEPIQRATWDNPSLLTVVRLHPDYYSFEAEHVLRVMGEAYDRLHGNNGTGLLPDGAALRYFNPRSEEAVERQRDRMDRAQSKGSVYFAAYESAHSIIGSEMVGVIKVSESWPLYTRDDKPNMYINDIAISEKGKKIGHRLLWVATHDFEPDHRVVADTQPGSGDFFENLGFEAKRRLVRKLNIAGHRIRQLREEAPTVSGVETAIATIVPGIREGHIIPKAA